MKELITDNGMIYLSINGKDFSFKASSEFASRLASLAAEAEKLAEDGASLSEASSFFSYAVDHLIGDGAVQRIFDDEFPDPLDLCDVLGYIADAFHSYRKERLRKIEEGYSW